MLRRNNHTHPPPESHHLWGKLSKLSELSELGNLRNVRNFDLMPQFGKEQRLFHKAWHMNLAT